MRYLFYDIHRTVMKAVERSGYSISRNLLMLGDIQILVLFTKVIFSNTGWGVQSNGHKG